MRMNIGYFAGTDSTLLTALVCEGYDTIPLSNGFDNHGRHVLLLNQVNKPDLIVGYLHKIMAPDEDADHSTYQDIFHACRIFEVPFLVAVPRELQDKARQLLDEVPDVVRFVDPEDLLDTIKDILG